eukprot:11169730-Karenia_brevis.AAC.1
MIRTGMGPSQLFLSCWIDRGLTFLEVEGHVLFDCPCYAAARGDFFEQICPMTFQDLLAGQTQME